MTRLSVAELASARIDWFVLDVREPEEIAFASIGDVVAIPLGELDQRVQELPKNRPIACLCHHGVRSAHAARFLETLGYATANIEGGIDAWSTRIDPSVPRY